MRPICLSAEECVFLMLDLQEKLIPAMSRGARCVGEAGRLLKCARILNVPALVTEQYPEGLGPTVGELRSYLDPKTTLAKNCFSCFDADGFETMLTATGRGTVVVFGVESHICVFTTAMALKARGYETVVAEGACASRDPADHDLATRNLIAAGIAALPTETIVYQLLRRGGTPEFKALLPLFK